MKQPWVAALYMRLSNDDGEPGDSGSIETQRRILHQYCEDNNITIYDEYVDDGWSGTNFDRPAFQRMMADIDKCALNCVITKDLSRLGREHIQVDHYLEYVFPEKRVRYVAVNDGEDSEKGMSDFSPFKNLFNEWYAKDTSRKVKAALKAKYEKGERIGPTPPLGYIWSPKEKGKLLIDEDTCWIIEKIYALALEGNGYNVIARYLRTSKVPTPGWIGYSRYGAYPQYYENAAEEKKSFWQSSAVRSILMDETYIGNTIHYRRQKISYKSKKRIHNSADEFYRVENTHPPLISRETFERVQENISRRRRSCGDGTPQLFAGLLKCSTCGKALKARPCHAPDDKAYVCRQYSEFGKEHCTAHYIRQSTLYNYVLSRIQYWTSTLAGNEIDFAQEIMNSSRKATQSSGGQEQAKLDDKKRRLRKIDGMLASLYEDRAEGNITPNNFSTLLKKYQDEQTALQEYIAAAEEAQRATDETQRGLNEWANTVKRYTHPTGLTIPMLNALIDKIVVHDRCCDQNGKPTQEIEIYYKFAGKLDQ